MSKSKNHVPFELNMTTMELVPRLCPQKKKKKKKKNGAGINHFVCLGTPMTMPRMSLFYIFALQGGTLKIDATAAAATHLRQLLCGCCF